MHILSELILIQFSASMKMYREAKAALGECLITFLLSSGLETGMKEVRSSRFDKRCDKKYFSRPDQQIDRSQIDVTREAQGLHGSPYCQSEAA